jgi:hypothetical protein
MSTYALRFVGQASADMMSLDASRHLWSARVDPRRRTYVAGIYTHLLDRRGISGGAGPTSGRLNLRQRR